MPKSALDIIKDTNQGEHSPAQHLIVHCIRLLPPITQASSRYLLNALPCVRYGNLKDLESCPRHK